MGYIRLGINDRFFYFDKIVNVIVGLNICFFLNVVIGFKVIIVFNLILVNYGK